MDTFGFTQKKILSLSEKNRHRHIIGWLSAFYQKLATNIEYQVALDGLRSLFNVGSIFRTCDAAGVKSVILGNTLGKEDPRVQKTAMGAQAVFSLTREH